ncbi:MAG TPA: 2Fe-2S iron-sulfur cluster binding domain-containing protein, partial [Phaeodactylibacter sp.]|nr:2Fe-2S iron-sulfur cluster binding domain-containing protein [Phaeodactylibacter sp.]
METIVFPPINFFRLLEKNTIVSIPNTHHLNTKHDLSRYKKIHIKLMTEFILNDKMVTTSEKTGVTLLQFIRENQHLKGTKSGCKEGDCGACTVLIGTLEADGSVRYKSVTSCLTPLVNVQNTHVVTVEGINLKNELTVAQQAMQNYHGTQCGFCTPGFVMSLTAYSLEKNNTLSCVESLGGNICRCTGYKSIEKAAEAIELNLKNNTGNMDWLAKNNFIPKYFKDIPSRLKKISSAKKSTTGTLVGGGTDLYVRHADILAEQNIRRNADLATDAISFSQNKCIIGGSTTVAQFLENKTIQSYFPKLKKHLKLVSSSQIRNRGSIAGNLVNASPIGDMSVYFLVLNSVLDVVNEAGERRKIALENFFLDYKKYDLQKGEHIANISFEMPESRFFNFEKVSKRTHLDIASVNAAIALQVKKNVITHADVSVGGVAAIPKYLPKTSAFLKNKEISTEIIGAAQAILQSEIAPISDVRGSK